MSAPFQPIDAFNSPRFSQPATFMRLPHSRDLKAIDTALVGIPFDGGTSYRPGTRFGPREIRAQSSMVRPYNHVLKANPFTTRRIADYGDIDVAPVSIERTYEKIEAAIAEILDPDVLPVSVGGDHSITHPILRAVAERWRALVRGKVYVTFDIDSVDPAYAPGTGTPEVGGLTSYEALGLVRALKGLQVVGFDLVEVSPLYDGPGQITALLGANLLYEFLCTLPPR